MSPTKPVFLTAYAKNDLSGRHLRSAKPPNDFVAPHAVALPEGTEQEYAARQLAAGSTIHSQFGATLRVFGRF